MTVRPASYTAATLACVALAADLRLVAATCSSNTGGTCWWGGCDGSRNAQCVNHQCVCAEGLCAEGGRCVSPDVPLPTDEQKNIRLTNWPIITTHDSATGLANSGTCTPLHQLNNYAVTQVEGPLSTQLDCGARAFDLRPYVNGGALAFHHGLLPIVHDFTDAINDVVSWANAHPGELVLIYTSHCAGSTDADKAACPQKVADQYAAAGIKYYRHGSDMECSNLWGMTLGEATADGLLPGGGSVIAFYNCLAGHYDSLIKCYDVATELSADDMKTKVPVPDAAFRIPASELLKLKNQPVPVNLEGVVPRLVDNSSVKLSEKDVRQLEDQPVPTGLYYTCYGTNAQQPFDALWSYMTKVTATSHSIFSMAQAHWQYDAASVVIGLGHGSCILEDESSSKVNEQLKNKIAAGEFPNINMLELDNVCDGGLDLLRTLRARAAGPAATSSAAALPAAEVSSPTSFATFAAAVVPLGIATAVLAVILRKRSRQVARGVPLLSEASTSAL